MNAIYNFYKVSDLLSCAGQPREGQLAHLADEGYEIVINLGLADGRYALKDEAASVQALGMEYYHIPVNFDSPQIEDLTSFIALMEKKADKKTFVHCAANYRASAFVGLYLFATGKLNEDEMEKFIKKIWRPEPLWQLFIEDGLDFLDGE